MDPTCVLLLQKGKQRLAQQKKKKPCECVLHMLSSRLGRMCYVMCWGLQHFFAVLHNRKPGTHCLPGLKKQACPVLPPPLPCDTGWRHVTSPGVGSKWPGFTVTDKARVEGGKKEGMHAFLELIHLHSRAFLLRWFWDGSFLFSTNAHFILHLHSAAESHVFSSSVSSLACHKISDGQLLAQFKVHHTVLVRQYLKEYGNTI